MARCASAALSITITVADSPTPTSEWAFVGAGGAMEYKASAEPETLGDTILDFSGVGYLYGADIPSPSEVGGTLVMLPHESGDQTSRIQATIDNMLHLPLDPVTGYRGTIQLEAGTWDVTATINLGVSGVVLSGVAGGTDTIISALEVGVFAQPISMYGPPVIRVGGLSQPGQSTSNPSGKTATMEPTHITSTRVPVGATSFEVADASEFARHLLSLCTYG